jgi:hypothetical protein
MKWRSNAAWSLVLVGLLACHAEAQRPQRPGGGRGQGMGGGVGQLLMNESVREELKIDEDQAATIGKIVQKVQESHRDEFTRLQNLSPTEQREKRRELSKSVNGEIMKDLGDMLKPDQAKRLKEIQLQAQGPQALGDPEIADALKLNDAQKEKIKSINDDLAAEMRAARPMGGGGGGGPGRGGVEKMAQLRKEGMNKVSNVLTDEQKKAWHEMTGKPFEIRFNRPGA